MLPRRPWGTGSEFFWHGYAAHRLLRSPLVASALVGVGVLQFLRGRVLGSPSALLFYALVIHYVGNAADTDRRRSS